MKIVHMHAISSNKNIDVLCKATAKCKTQVVILLGVAGQWNERSPLFLLFFSWLNIRMVMIIFLSFLNCTMLTWRSFSCTNEEVHENRALNRVLWSCTLNITTKQTRIYQHKCAWFFEVTSQRVKENVCLVWVLILKLGWPLQIKKCPVFHSLEYILDQEVFATKIINLIRFYFGHVVVLHILLWASPFFF